MTHTVAIVPAWNRADRIGATVRALLGVEGLGEVVVVDDGSTDATPAAAREAGARVVTLDDNVGKGGAVAAGVAASGAPDRYLLLDADLAETAAQSVGLLEAQRESDAELVIARFPRSGRSRGFGVVKRVAAAILGDATGRRFDEPLSGQRVIDGPLLRSLDLAPRFGLEVAMTLDVAERGLSIVETPVEFQHRATGRDLSGMAHRARQGRDLLVAASHRLGWRRTLKSTLRGLVGVRR